MKAKNLGGREPILVCAGPKSITFGEEQRRIIAERKGDRGISEYIRDLVMADADSITDPNVGKADRKEIIQLRKELEHYKNINARIKNEERDKMVYIAKGLKMYKSEHPNREEVLYRDWIRARCKGDSVDVQEFMRFQFG